MNYHLLQIILFLYHPVPFLSMCSIFHIARGQQTITTVWPNETSHAGPIHDAAPATTNIIRTYAPPPNLYLVALPPRHRKSRVYGKPVELGGPRIIKKK